jgi:multicomponent Na+:H+ antiporter subunit G
MTELRHAISVIVLALGIFFMLVGSIGVVRLPDYFARIHATGKSDTLGIMLSLGGLALFEGLTVDGIKLLLAIVFVGLTSPVGAHALAKAAFRYGLKPWFHDDQKPE